MKHIARIDKSPSLSGKSSTPDGALCGNGDLCAILGNSPDGLRIYLAKCDIWYGVENYHSGGIRPLGQIDIPVPAELYANYFVEQDMDLAEIRCRFSQEDRYLSLTIRVNKSENSLVIEPDGTEKAEARLNIPEGETAGDNGKSSAGAVSYIYRFFTGDDCEYDTEAYAYLTRTPEGRYYLFAATNHDCDEPKEEAERAVSEITDDKICALKEKHRELWKEFYDKSEFSLSDPELEIGWYASQYILAVCAGNIKFPPGLYGNFITVEKVGWHGDYHLNYNYQAPFYGACSSNHVELTDCYHAPLEEFAERKGRENAKKFGCGGIFFPVGIAPKGLFSELDPDCKYAFERTYMGQMNNAMHALDIMIFRWNSTRNKDYAKNHLYPLLKDALKFMSDYAVFENGVFNICRDAAHEVPYYQENFDPKKWKKFINDRNNVVTLGLLRLCLGAAIDISAALDADEEERKEWEYMLSHLPEFPTFYYGFKKVFRYTEKGMRWNDTGDVGLQHVYPCGCVGLGSDPELKKIAVDTFNVNGRWLDGNGVSSFMPMAARLGIKPERITKHLREFITKLQLPNMLYLEGGGCLEYSSVTATTLNEMALQSHQGVVRIFPNWDKAIDCSYRNLRADGAFLVSASINDGIIGEVNIISEAGEKLRLVNPFDKCFLRNSSEEYVFRDRVITISTHPDEKITVSRL